MKKWQQDKGKEKQVSNIRHDSGVSPETSTLKAKLKWTLDENIKTIIPATIFFFFFFFFFAIPRKTNDATLISDPIWGPQNFFHEFYLY